MKFTVAGTVPDFNWIPCYASNDSLEYITKTRGKGRDYFPITQRFLMIPIFELIFKALSTLRILLRMLLNRAAMINYYLFIFAALNWANVGKKIPLLLHSINRLLQKL